MRRRVDAWRTAQDRHDSAELALSRAEEARQRAEEALQARQIALQAVRDQAVTDLSVWAEQHPGPPGLHETLIQRLTSDDETLATDLAEPTRHAL